LTRAARLRRLVAELLPDYLSLVEPESARLFDLQAVRLLAADVPAWSRRERATAGVIAEVAELELLRLFYTGFGLSEAAAEHYLGRPEPLAWALAAAMRPRRCSRAELRRACLARIAAADLPPRAQGVVRGLREVRRPVVQCS
jgi:hypothetical protein